MSLMDGLKKEAEETPAEVGTTKKKHNNSEYQKKARERALKAAQCIDALLKEKNIKLTDEQKEAMDTLLKVRKPTAGFGGGKGVIYKIFGDAPKKGASKTALEIFTEHQKGYPEMKKQIKKWKEQGIDVAFDESKKVYVLNSNVPAYVAK